MNLIPTITIGIPAHNEAKNIGKLINLLLLQRFDKLTLEKIIIINDGSTDDTKEIVSNIYDDKIHLVNQRRLGKATALNEIHKLAGSDYLVTLDADVLINDDKFIEKVVSALVGNAEIGLASCKVLPTNSNTFVNKIVNFSYITKLSIFESDPNNNSAYLCHGRTRAYSKSFYKKLQYPDDIIADDAFSYFACLKHNFKFHYEKQAIVYFTSPKTFLDFIKQNKRYKLGKSQLSAYFSKKLLLSKYKLSTKNFAHCIMLCLAKNPVYTFTYLGMLLIAGLKSGNFGQGYLWKMAESSKEVKL